MLYSLKILVLGFIAVIISACSAPPGVESTGEYFDSTAITTRVKAGLVDELGSSGFAIKVKTYKDNVQLSGFVDNPRVKQRAGTIAKGVNGVLSVRNDIIVKRY